MNFQSPIKPSGRESELRGRHLDPAIVSAPRRGRHVPLAAEHPRLHSHEDRQPAHLLGGQRYQEDCRHQRIPYHDEK